jgi:hypothetical protein
MADSVKWLREEAARLALVDPPSNLYGMKLEVVANEIERLRGDGVKVGAEIERLRTAMHAADVVIHALCADDSEGLAKKLGAWSKAKAAVGVNVGANGKSPDAASDTSMD